MNHPTTDRVLRGLDLRGIDAADWSRVVAGLVAEAAPTLAVARVTGGAIALGRHEPVDGTLSEEGRAKPRTRRLTGGRAIALGEGMLAIALVLPHRAWLVGGDPSALPASRVLNRCVRGLLGGLARVGLPANYFGRDFVTAGGGRFAFLGFDIDARGVTLVECIVPLSTHWWPDPAWIALPPRTPVRGVPDPVLPDVTLPTDPTRWLDVLAAGFEERLAVRVEASRAPHLVTPASIASGPVVPDPPALARGSGRMETPAGFVEARATASDGRFLDATLVGELLATSGTVDAIRAGLRGRPVQFDAVAEVLDRVFADAGHAAPGIDDLSVLANALVKAGTTP